MNKHIYSTGLNFAIEYLSVVNLQSQPSVSTSDLGLTEKLAVSRKALPSWDLSTSKRHTPHFI